MAKFLLFMVIVALANIVSDMILTYVFIGG